MAREKKNFQSNTTQKRDREREREREKRKEEKYFGERRGEMDASEFPRCLNCSGFSLQQKLHQMPKCMSDTNTKAAMS